jgi:hypothetical protein
MSKKITPGEGDKPIDKFYKYVGFILASVSFITIVSTLAIANNNASTERKTIIATQGEILLQLQDKASKNDIRELTEAQLKIIETLVTHIAKDSTSTKQDLLEITRMFKIEILDKFKKKIDSVIHDTAKKPFKYDADITIEKIKK